MLKFSAISSSASFLSYNSLIRLNKALNSSSEKNSIEITNKNEPQNELSGLSELRPEDSIINPNSTFTSPVIWFFIIAAIIVLIICFVIAQPEQEWFKDLKMVTWAQNTLVWSIIFVIVIIIMAYCSSYAFDNTKNPTTTPP